MLNNNTTENEFIIRKTCEKDNKLIKRNQKTENAYSNKTIDSKVIKKAKNEK